jgi:hypothetical protein
VENSTKIPGIKINNVIEQPDGFFDAEIEVSPEYQCLIMEKLDWKEWDEDKFAEIINATLLEYVNNKRVIRGESKIKF